MSFFDYIFKSRLETSEGFFSELRNKLGFNPKNKEIYRCAFTHSSLNIKDDSGNEINFERLEFLGDALLSVVISEYLFFYFPRAKEGELTRLRAKIVSRDNLNKIGERLDLIKLTYTSEDKKLGNDIHGNLLESLLGAIFIDKGYQKSKKIVLEKFIRPYVNIKNLDEIVLSYKELLNEWVQKNKHKMRYDTYESGGVYADLNFESNIFVNSRFVAKNQGISKKKAEEKAAQKACSVLGVVG